MNKNGGASGIILLVVKDDSERVVCLSAYSETCGEDIVRRAPESFFGHIKELVGRDYQKLVDWFEELRTELCLERGCLEDAHYKVFIDTTLPYRCFELSHRNGKFLDEERPRVVASPFSENVRRLAEITKYRLHNHD